MRALVRAIHRLADGGRGSGDDAGRKRGGEDVGPANEAQDLELWVVGDAEAADRADGLGESADDEVDVVDHALRLGHSAAVLADEAHRVRFVVQHHSAIGPGDGDHVLQRSDVAEHRIDAFEDHELARTFGDALKPPFERLDVIVAERYDLGIAERTAIVNRRVAVDVEDDVILFTGDGGNDSEIGLVAGREDHGVVHRVELFERVLAGTVPGIGAVENSAAGRARAELIEGLLARCDDFGIEGHPHVVVGAEQDGAAAVADRYGRTFHPFHHEVERIGEAGPEKRVALVDYRIELGEEIGHAWSFSKASASWPTLSISACRFIEMSTSNSSSMLATKSSTVRLSHSRSWAKRVLSLTATPFLLNGSISSRTLERVC